MTLRSWRDFRRENGTSVLGWAGRRLAPLVTALGLTPRTVTLETTGRRSGKKRRTSVTVATYEGHRYVVSLYGEQAAWVANVRAADGRACIVAGSRTPIRLVEIPAADRAPILHAWVSHRAFTHSPEGSARTFFGYDHVPSVDELDPVAWRYPVFRIEELHHAGPRAWPHSWLYGLGLTLILAALATRVWRRQRRSIQ